MILTSESVDEIMWCDIQMKATEQYFPVVEFIFGNFTKSNLGFVLNFDFQRSWELVKGSSQSELDRYICWNISFQH